MTVGVAGLIPHAGAMCLLRTVSEWSDEAIACLATSHLDPANPLRRGGILPGVCGIEYALQAAAAHGALHGGQPQPPGFVASLRVARLCTERLDRPALGTLTARARREAGDGNGLLYRIGLEAQDGQVLLDARATIMLSRA